jgi:hypothetical protein
VLGDDRQRGDGAEPDDGAELVGRFSDEDPVEAQHVGGVVSRLRADPAAVTKPVLRLNSAQPALRVGTDHWLVEGRELDLTGKNVSGLVVSSSAPKVALRNLRIPQRIWWRRRLHRRGRRIP